MLELLCFINRACAEARSAAKRGRDPGAGSSSLLSITDHAANLHILSEPLIPLPEAVLLDTDPARLLDLPQTYQDFVPPQGPVPSVAPPPAVLSREGPFDASIEPTATGGHPLIIKGVNRVPLLHDNIS